MYNILRDANFKTAIVLILKIFKSVLSNIYFDIKSDI